MEKCVVCGKPVPDYKPEYCCDGRECGCRGLPIEPCLCSYECGEKLFGRVEKQNKDKPDEEMPYD